ncbi:uncharacterized protein LOC118437695 [Folsomia candida]|uniref:uncharacterized protein LOC118437695 n=1 Tax=Folsomia candida TaxID=158441 RepID=UPI001604BD2B|nr:uncharacterized protein LOC118437695 [Folsomia candida]
MVEKPFLTLRQRSLPSTASSSSSSTTPTLTVDFLRAGGKVVHPGVMSCFPRKKFSDLDKDELREYKRLSAQRCKHIASNSTNTWIPVLEPKYKKNDDIGVHPAVLSCFPGKTYSSLDEVELREYNRLAKQRSRHVVDNPTTPWVPVLEHAYDRYDDTGIHPTVMSCFPGMRYADLDVVQLREYRRLTAQRSRHIASNPSTPWIPALMRRIYQHKTEFDKKFGKLGVLRPGDAPSQKLLEYLGLDPDTRFLSSGINISVNDETTADVSQYPDYAKKTDAQLRTKFFWDYVCVGVNWPETVTMSRAEVEAHIIKNKDDGTREILIYLGLNSLERSSNKYHPKSGTMHDLILQGYRFFDACYIDCNLGNVHQTTGRTSCWQWLWGRTPSCAESRDLAKHSASK